MSGIIILGVSVLIFLTAYLVYGSWLARQWGVDPSRKTPAHTEADGVDYVPAKAPVLLGHHFSSIAGAGSINGTIQAAVFGWLPVLLWIIIGGIFFGAVQDFSALFASIRHGGKSLGEVIEENIGRKAKICFTVFAWLMLVLVTAAFADIVAGTFDGFPMDAETGKLVKNSANGSVAAASMLFIPVAVCFGFINRTNINLVFSTFMGVVLLGICIMAGLMFPVYFTKNTWTAVIFVYIFLASVVPVWILLQPRDYLNSFLFYFMMIAAAAGICLANPKIKLEPFTGWEAGGNTLFPFLFITAACGAVSGFHSLVGSGTTSKQLNSEKDARRIGYGGMLIECVLAVAALIAAGSLTKDGVYTDIGTPPQVFAAAIGEFFAVVGVGEYGEQMIHMMILLAVSAFALTTLDTAARVGRLLFQELFKTEKGRHKFFGNVYVSTIITIGTAGLLTLAGYQRIWDLFGACNQLAAVLAFLAAACWLKNMGKNRKMLYVPMLFLLAASLSTLGITFYQNLKEILHYRDRSSLMVQGVQNVLIVPVVIMAAVMVFDGCRVLFRRKKTMKEDA